MSRAGAAVARPAARRPGIAREGMEAIGAELRTYLPPPDPISLRRQLADLDRSAAMDEGNPLAMSKDESTLTRIMVAIATLTERQSAIMKAGDADRAIADAHHRETMARFDTFVPRAEIETRNRAVDARLDDMGKRVDEVDGRLRKGVWWLLTTLGGLVAGGLGLGFHLKGG